MPSSPRTRQVRLLAIVAVLIVVIILYVTTAARATRDAEFYQRTSVRMREQQRVAEQARTDGDVSRRLHAAEERAKQRAEERATERRAQLAAERAGAPPVPEPVRKPAGEERRREKAVTKNEGDGESERAQEAEAAEMEAELNAILKKSPVVIFSKTYCRFSMKAKQIFGAYNISPKPYIVELDEHPRGAKLQDALGKHTGRRTVPNIMINGQSIGGGDDVEQLHEEGKLIEKVKSLGKQRIVEMKLV